MKIRNLAIWILGAWIAGSLFMIMVATQNFRSVDRLLASPGGLAPKIEQMGAAEARTFLRYQVSEQNRFYFETWEKIQLALGIVLLGAVFAGMPGNKLCVSLAVAVFVLLLAERFYITPEIVRIGRMIDFVPLAAPSPERDLFWKFHGAYSGVELTKLAIQFLLSVRIGLGLTSGK